MPTVFCTLTSSEQIQTFAFLDGDTIAYFTGAATPLMYLLTLSRQTLGSACVLSPVAAYTTAATAQLNGAPAAAAVGVNDGTNVLVASGAHLFVVTRTGGVTDLGTTKNGDTGALQQLSSLTLSSACTTMSTLMMMRGCVSSVGVEQRSMGAYHEMMERASLLAGLLCFASACSLALLPACSLARLLACLDARLVDGVCVDPCYCLTCTAVPTTFQTSAAFSAASAGGSPRTSGTTNVVVGTPPSSESSSAAGDHDDAATTTSDTASDSNSASDVDTEIANDSGTAADVSNNVSSANDVLVRSIGGGIAVVGIVAVGVAVVLVRRHRLGSRSSSISTGVGGRVTRISGAGIVTDNVSASTSKHDVRVGGAKVLMPTAATVPVVTDGSINVSGPMAVLTRTSTSGTCRGDECVGDSSSVNKPRSRRSRQLPRSSESARIAATMIRISKRRLEKKHRAMKQATGSVDTDMAGSDSVKT